MSKKSRFRWWLWLRPGLVLPVFVAGCMCHGDGACDSGGLSALRGRFDKCATIPAGAIPVPIGTHSNEIFDRQVAKGRADNFVIYLYEWSGDTANFGPFGSRHIDRIASQLPKENYPVVLEPDCDPAVNEARRLSTVAYLEQHGNPDASKVVVVGYPQAEGLYGDQAEPIYRRMLGNTFGNTNAINRGAGGGIGGIGGAGGAGGIGGIGAFGGY